MLPHVFCHAWRVNLSRVPGMQGCGLKRGSVLDAEAATDVYARAQHTLLLAMGETFHRLIKPYESFPLRLASILDPRLSEPQKLSIADAFLKCKQCCSGKSFGVKLQQLCRQPSDLLQGPLYNFLRVTFAMKSINVHIECNFARASKQRQQLHGQPQRIATLTTKHILAELVQEHARSQCLQVSKGMLPGFLAPRMMDAARTKRRSKKADSGHCPSDSGKQNLTWS
jgi:hypothetical protein